VTQSFNGTLIGNHMLSIEWHHSLNDLQGHFAVWNLSNSHTSWNVAWIY